MILMEGDVIQAEAMLQKLRALIGPVQSLGQSIAFTISAGVCQTEDGASTLTQLMHNADQALYRAKRQGRNRSVMLHEDEPHAPRPTTRLVIVGCGIQFARHVSERTLSEIRQAEVVFCLADSFALGMVREMRPDVIDLSGHYANGKDRRQTYRDMEAALMQPLLDGKQVCAVFYGHPGVFADVPHKVMRQARAMGIDARMEPGISAEACLYADLGIDPGQRGVQSMEATHFMVYDRQLDPASLVLLWQVTLTGDLSCTRTEADPAALRALVDRLLTWYPPEHEVILYEAANVPIQNPRGDRLRLCDLPHAHYREFTTLVIPPLVELQAVDLQFVRLGKRD
jgi:precorrin-6B methylase 1